jgi:hypothetical protein
MQANKNETSIRNAKPFMKFVRPAFTTDEEKQNAMFDQQRLDVAARMALGRPYSN